MKRAEPERMDLFNLTQDQSRQLAEFLQSHRRQYPNSRFIPASCEMIDEHNNKLRLSHALIYSAHTDSYILFDFTKSEIGKGAFGAVYPSIGEIKIENGVAYTESNSNYVVKKGNKNSSFEQEAAIAQPISYLQVQAPISFNDERYLLMKRIQGEDLRSELKFLKEESVEELIDLSLKFLYQLQEKIHLNNILHMDIKPDNIIIQNKNKAQHTYSPRIIDFGVSEKADSKNLSFAGTLEYFSPEKANDIIILEGDLYAMGLTLAEIWGHELPEIKPKDQNSALYNLLINPNELNLNLKKIKNENLSPAIKDLIEEAIAVLVKRDYTQRSLDNAIDAFNLARIECMIERDLIPKEKSKSVYWAVTIARLARKELRALNCDPSTMQEHIIHALNKLDDNEYTITAFADVTNIKAFKNCKSKSECENQMNSIIASFDFDTVNKMIREYNAFYRIVNAVSVKKISDEWNKLIYYNNKIKQLKLFPAKLDNMNKPDINKIIQDYKNEDFIDAPGELKKIHKIICKLSLDFEKNKDNIFKTKLLSAVDKYINETMTSNNFKKKDRVFSDRRLNDVEYILPALERLEDQKDIAELLERRFKSPEFTTGFFGRSSLRDGVLKAIKEDQKQSRLKK